MSGGVIDRDDVGRKDVSNNDKSSYKLILPGDIGYNTMRMWQGVSGLSKLRGIVSPAYTIVTPDNKNIDARYVRAGLEEPVTPHTLRHTAATWLMHKGVPLWEASRFLGMTQETLENVYGHHHTDHLREAAAAIGFQRRESLAETLAATRLKKSANASSQEVTENVEKNGGPAWTRTRNQTVMSADDISSDVENTDEFGSFDRDF